MRIAANYVEQSQYSFDGADTARVRAVVVDGSPTYLQAVCALLDFHEIVDLVGRAAKLLWTAWLCDIGFSAGAELVPFRF